MGIGGGGGGGDGNLMDALRLSLIAFQIIKYFTNNLD